MKREIIPLTIAAGLALFFLSQVILTFRKGFNQIPYVIYEFFSRDSGGAHDFIFFFDLVTAGIIFLLVYKILTLRTRKRA